jgi:hypothetical protein
MQYETPEKITNEQASEYDISIAISSLLSQYVNPRKK